MRKLRPILLMLSMLLGTVAVTAAAPAQPADALGNWCSGPNISTFYHNGSELYAAANCNQQGNAYRIIGTCIERYDWGYGDWVNDDGPGWCGWDTRFDTMAFYCPSPGSWYRARFWVDNNGTWLLAGEVYRNDFC